MLKIKDIDKLKITSITRVIHFKYDNEHYFIHENQDYTTTTALYKGRSKFKNECIKSKYGFINNLIKYKNNKKVLSAIDKMIKFAIVANDPRITPVITVHSNLPIAM